MEGDGGCAPVNFEPTAIRTHTGQPVCITWIKPTISHISCGDLHSMRSVESG